MTTPTKTTQSQNNNQIAIYKQQIKRNIILLIINVILSNVFIVIISITFSSYPCGDSCDRPNYISWLEMICFIGILVTAVRAVTNLSRIMVYTAASKKLKYFNK
ncbi:MAG: hypothetical protein WCH58_04070 [Candidatus Saccharibacteria bacterium]